MARPQDNEGLTEIRAQNLALGVGEKVHQGVGTYNTTDVAVAQCDIDTDYEAVYVDGTTLPRRVRLANSVRGGMFSSVTVYSGELILHLDPSSVE